MDRPGNIILDKHCSLEKQTNKNKKTPKPKQTNEMKGKAPCFTSHE